MGTERHVRSFFFSLFVEFGSHIHLDTHTHTGTPQDVVNDSKECNMSQVSEFLKSLNTAMPIFGVTFLVGNFIFLVAWCVTFITAIFCGNPTACLGQEMDNITDSSTFDGYDERDLDINNDALEMSERKVS